MAKAIVNGITRPVPKIKPCCDVQFAFKSWRQLLLFMVWRVWYNEAAEVEFGSVFFNSIDWIGF